MTSASSYWDRANDQAGGELHRHAERVRCFAISASWSRTRCREGIAPLSFSEGRAERRVEEESVAVVKESCGISDVYTYWAPLMGRHPACYLEVSGTFASPSLSILKPPLPVYSLSGVAACVGELNRSGSLSCFRFVQISMRVLKKLPVKSILEHLYPMKGTLRTVKIATPNKHGEEHLIRGKAEPLVAFDNPRLPPVLGPLIVLSFLGMSSSNEEDD